MEATRLGIFMVRYYFSGGWGGWGSQWKGYVEWPQGYEVPILLRMYPARQKTRVQIELPRFFFRSRATFA